VGQTDLALADFGRDPHNSEFDSFLCLYFCVFFVSVFVFFLLVLYVRFNYK